MLEMVQGLSPVMSVYSAGPVLVNSKATYTEWQQCATHFSQDSIAKSIWLDKRERLSAVHDSTIVGILWNLELVELVTIKFTDKIDFTVMAVALGQRIM